jgi:methyl-accepting chemotaxis protein
MKFRVSFTLKIILPYLLMASIFLVILMIEADSGHTLITGLSAAGMAGSLLIGVTHLFWLRRPLDRIRRLLVQLTRGNLPSFKASGTSDEIGELERHLEKHVNNLHSLTKFTRDIASGDFSGSFEKLSGEDEIGEAILALKGSLEESVKETETRRREEENRTWTAQGMAKFSQLFREAEDDLQALSYELMKELVDYTDADVGALFITGDAEDGKPLLELTGSYAFDREKHIQKSFGFGEGLVGRAALEKDVIYITDLPPETLKIRSGLGEDLPSSLLLVPVLLDDQVLGVIELASLGEIPPYQVHFIRQLGEALATTLAKVQASLETRRQAEALASQEKVFRKQLEELRGEIERLRES